VRAQIEKVICGARARLMKSGERRAHTHHIYLGRGRGGGEIGFFGMQRKMIHRPLAAALTTFLFPFSSLHHFHHRAAPHADWLGCLLCFCSPCSRAREHRRRAAHKHAHLEHGLIFIFVLFFIIQGASAAFVFRFRPTHNKCGGGAQKAARASN